MPSLLKEGRVHELVLRVAIDPLLNFRDVTMCSGRCRSVYVAAHENPWAAAILGHGAMNSYRLICKCKEEQLMLLVMCA